MPIHLNRIWFWQYWWLVSFHYLHQECIKIYLKGSKGPIHVLACETNGSDTTTPSGQLKIGRFLTLEESRIETMPLLTGYSHVVIALIKLCCTPGSQEKSNNNIYPFVFCRSSYNFFCCPERIRFSLNFVNGLQPILRSVQSNCCYSPGPFLLRGTCCCKNVKYVNRTTDLPALFLYALPGSY